MFPFKVIMVGVEDESTALIKKELTTLGAVVEESFTETARVLDKFATPSDLTDQRLFLVTVKSAKDAEGVLLLRKRFDKCPIIALATVVDGPVNLVAANRAGANQVVPLPFASEDFQAAMKLVGTRARLPSERKSLSVSVTGSIPGCGASTLATTLASEIARLHQAHTILVETGLQMGVLAINLNAQPRVTVADLVAIYEHINVQELQNALLPINDHLDLLAGASNMVNQSVHSVAGILKVLALARELADVVVADVRCTYDDLQFELLWSADHIVIVCDQSIPAIRTTKMILDASKQMQSAKAITVVLNRYDSSIGGLTIEKIAQTLSVKDLIAVPNDYCSVMKATSEGKTLRDVVPNSVALAAISAFAGRIYGHISPAVSSRGVKLFSRILKAFTG